MKHHKSFKFSSTFLLILTSIYSMAEDDIEKITVTATPFTSEIQANSASVSVLSGTDKLLDQSLSLGGTLESLPGVSNIATGSQAGKPVIRGLTGDRIRILVDGVAQDHQQFGVRHIPNVDPFLFEQIEVVRGPMSVLYGSGAMGGVINLIPRTILYGEETKPLQNGKVTSRYGTMGNEKMLGLEGNGGSEYFGWTGALSSNSSDGIETPEVVNYPDSPESDAPKFSGKLPNTDYEVVDGTLGLGVQHEDLLVEGRLTYWQNQQNYLMPTGGATGQELINTNAVINTEWDAGLEWKLKSKLSWQKNSRIAGTGVSYQELTPDTKDLDLGFDRYNALIDVKHPNYWGFEGELGVEWLKKEQDIKTGELVPDATEKGTAIYLFEQRNFNDLTLQLGARYDNVSLQAKSDEHVQLDDTEKRDWSAFSGSAGLTWEMLPELFWVGHIARGFRAPTVFELYANGVHGGISAYQKGNPNLEEEYSVTTDISFRWFTEKGSVVVTAYHNEIDNYIYQANSGETHEGTALPIYQIEQENANLNGVEVELNAQLTEAINFNIVYEQVRGSLKETKDNLPLLPADNIESKLSWKGGSKGYFQNPTGYISYKHTMDKGSAGTYEPFSQFDKLPFGTASTEAYNLIGIGVGFNVKSVRFDLQVSNLLDEEYRDFLDTYKGYAMSPGRNVMFTLGWQFK